VLIAGFFLIHPNRVWNILYLSSVYFASKTLALILSAAATESAEGICQIIVW